MTEHEVGELTGLSLEAARLAMDRLASEPFISTSYIHQEALERCVAEEGATVTRGGRFWHLLGAGVDKGRAVAEVLSRLNLEDGVPTAAVGDAWNDLPMLERVGRAYLLGEAVSKEDVPAGVTHILSVGPSGFVQAALDFKRRCL